MWFVSLSLSLVSLSLIVFVFAPDASWRMSRFDSVPPLAMSNSIWLCTLLDLLPWAILCKLTSFHKSANSYSVSYNGQYRHRGVQRPNQKSSLQEFSSIIMYGRAHRLDEANARSNIHHVPQYQSEHSKLERRFYRCTNTHIQVEIMRISPTSY